MFGAREGIPEPDLLGEAHRGDFSQGNGVSTSQLANVNVALTEGDRDAQALSRKHPVMQSPGIWLLLAGLLVGIKLLSEKAGQASEFSTIRIGLENWTIGGLIAVTFLFVFKVGVALAPWKNGFMTALRQFAGVV